MIFRVVAMFAAAAQPAAPASVTISESECFAMVQKDAEVVSTQVPGLYVIERTAGDGFSAPELPAGTSAIMCPRSSVVPAPNDWKVLGAGYPLFILESSAPPETRRVGVLELSRGQFRYRFTRGALTAQEEPHLQARLDQLQQSLQK